MYIGKMKMRKQIFLAPTGAQERLIFVYICNFFFVNIFNLFFANICNIFFLLIFETFSFANTCNLFFAKLWNIVHYGPAGVLDT